MKLTGTHYKVLRVMFQRLERYGHVRSSDLEAALGAADATSSTASAAASSAVGSIGAAETATAGQIGGLLEELAALGLVDRPKLRLTFAGLAVAVATGARRHAREPRQEQKANTTAAADRGRPVLRVNRKRAA